MAVAWQATIIVLVAVAIGLPLGIIIGRWLWSSFAGELGVAPDSLLPVAALAITVPVALVVGNLVASVPAWAAGRVEPSRILRAE
jgi:ABC-type antimicrobial peptide transport system permease subunit